MNWGIKIVIGMGAFMSFIVILGILMVRSETDALVESNYYEKGLNYNNDYFHKENVIKDQAAPMISIAERTLRIQFKSQASGTLKLLRASNQHLDRSLSFETDSPKVILLSTAGLSKGRWKVILRWKNDNGAEYLYEKETVLP